jgi:hypothetical protein
MIYCIKRSLLVYTFFLVSGIICSQGLYEQADKVYGLDPLLYNGKKYTYFLPPGTGGNQYFLSSDFITGEVTIRGKSFTGILLNYDIYNQRLLLQYNDESGAVNILEISEAWLERFHLGPSEFIFLTNEGDSRIYQVLGDGPFYILYHWRKDLRLTNSTGASNYSFSPPQKNRHVLIGGILYPLRSEGGFVGLFKPEHKMEIKSYMHTNKINLKNSSDREMTELINYIGNL